MANNYFSFKEFTIHQDLCAMKVSTDACLFGAFVADFLSQQATPPRRVLDIGAGTGLLSLMLAQKNSSSHFTAVELDADAAKQARQNILESPWAERIELVNADIITWEEKERSLFNLVICNPPFFNQHLVSDKNNRAMARHDESLSLAQLLVIAQRCLTENGFFAILLPHMRMEACIQLFQASFHLIVSLESSDKIDKSPNRFIGIFSKTPISNHAIFEKLALHESDGKRSAQWDRLISAYYLH